MLTLGRLGCSSIFKAVGIQRCKVIKLCVLLRIRLQVDNQPIPILGHCCRREKRTDVSVIQEVKLMFFFCSLHTSACSGHATHNSVSSFLFIKSTPPIFSLVTGGVLFSSCVQKITWPAVAFLSLSHTSSEKAPVSLFQVLFFFF